MPKKLSPVGGAKTVTTAGTAEAIVASETRAIQVVFMAKAANTNPIFLGDSNVDKDTSPQIALAAGASLSLQAPAHMYIDLSEWYVDATTNGEGVDFVYAI